MRAHGRERERKRGLLAAWSIGTDSVCFHRGNELDTLGENRIHMRKRENELFLNETLKKSPQLKLNKLAKFPKKIKVLEINIFQRLFLSTIKINA